MELGKTKRNQRVLPNTVGKRSFRSMQGQKLGLESIHEERKRDKKVYQEVENTQDRGEKRV